MSDESTTGPEVNDEPEETEMPTQAPTRVKRHVEGDGKLERCNVAESHAIENPGHSVTTIVDYKVGDDSITPFLSVTCNGDPAAFERGRRNCYFHEDLPINQE